MSPLEEFGYTVSIIRRQLADLRAIAAELEAQGGQVPIQDIEEIREIRDALWEFEYER